LYLPISSRSS